MLKSILVISLAGAVYSYFVYPIILLLLTRNTARAEDGEWEKTPKISLIITVYNEELRIESKIQDSLKLDYPPDKLEIIVASDCSNDRTEEIVSGYQEKGIKLVRADQHNGKEYAQKCAIAMASGDVLVFSDVATSIPREALNHLVKYYASTGIGAISSEDRFINQSGEIAGEGLYVKYEMWLRKLESAAAGLVGLSGSFFSCRKEVAENWDVNSPSDFNTAINCARLGFKAVTAQDVLGYYKDLSDPGKEYQRKVRTVLRGMTGMANHLDVLNPVSFGLFSFQVFSHKVMRWSVPFFLLLSFLVNLLLVSAGPEYQFLLCGQLVFYLSGLVAHYSTSIRRFAVIRIIYFFLLVNVAIAHALVLFLSGTRMLVWQPSKR